MLDYPDLCRSTAATHVPEQIYCTCISLAHILYNYYIDIIMIYHVHSIWLAGVASIILLCHNLEPKDAMPVKYFIQYAGLILETIHNFISSRINFISSKALLHRSHMYTFLLSSYVLSELLFFIITFIICQFSILKKGGSVLQVLYSYAII